MRKTGPMWPVSLLAPRGPRPPFGRASDQSRPPVRRLHLQLLIRFSHRAGSREDNAIRPVRLISPFVYVVLLVNGKLGGWHR